MDFFKKLFTSKAPKTGTIFIVEDNKVFAHTLQAYLTKSFPALKSVEIFPVGETCIPELERRPDAIIIDYFLDSRYTDAANGLEIIRQIREIKPEQNIIVLSAQQDVDVVIEAVKKYDCTYIKKNDASVQKIKEIVQEIINS